MSINSFDVKRLTVYKFNNFDGLKISCFLKKTKYRLFLQKCENWTYPLTATGYFLKRPLYGLVISANKVFFPEDDLSRFFQRVVNF